MNIENLTIGQSFTFPGSAQVNTVAYVGTDKGLTRLDYTVKSEGPFLYRFTVTQPSKSTVYPV